LFGGIREYGAGPGQGAFADIAANSFYFDDITFPDTPSGCQPVPDVSPIMPGPGFIFPSSIRELAVTPESEFGLLITSDAGFLSPYIATIDQYWIDDDPNNDSTNRFTHAYLNCHVTRRIPMRRPVPLVNPQTGTWNTADGIVVGPQGLLGVQRPNRVFRVPRTGDAVIDIATLTSAADVGGIGVFPAQNVTNNGVVIVVEIDSPVNVLLTDAEGRRIGVDAGGQAVNDFGDEFALDTGPASRPRFYVVKKPAPGDYQLRSIGTDSGPYAVHVYGMDLSQRFGHHVVNQGETRLARWRSTTSRSTPAAASCSPMSRRSSSP
jgi:hypothetical protein